MKKVELAEIITNSPAWNGLRNVKQLCSSYSKRELEDIYSMLDEEETNYFESIYN